MAYDESPNHAQQLEQAIVTAFACRTIIKYNSTLSQEQKNEILAELDTTLQFLRKRLIATTTPEARAVIPPLAPQQLAELFASSMENAEDEESEMASTDYSLPQEMQTPSEPLMQNLYKLYHAYLNTQPGKGMNALETRYSLAMDILDDVRAVIEKQRYTSSGENIEQLLYQVGSFITVLYCMFREFAAVLAKILEGKDITTETDELKSLQKYTAVEMHQYLLRDIAPLMRVYGAQLQLQQRKGSVANLVSDATAFLIFLEERLGPEFSRRQEVVEQLKAVAELLHDLSSLLSDYEQALSAVLPLQA